MATGLKAKRLGNIIQDPWNHADPNFLADEKEWFECIHDAIIQDDVPHLTNLIEILDPPIEYLQDELFVALIRNLPDAACCLLEFGAEIDDTIAWTACTEGRRSIKVFEIFLKHGWDVNNDMRGCTPLSMVLKDEALVRWLLEHGADPKIGRSALTKSGSSMTTNSREILFHATSRSAVNTLNLLISYGASLEMLSLHGAVSCIETEERMKMIKRLMELGADVDELDNPILGLYSMGTPLLHAAEANNLQSTRLLLENGADPCVLGKYGIALTLAEGRFMEIVQWAARGSWPDKWTDKAMLARRWLIWRALYVAIIKKLPA